MAGKFNVYQDQGGSWRWRLRAGNNEIVAVSGEGFSSKQAAIGGCEAVQRACDGAAVEEAG